MAGPIPHQLSIPITFNTVRAGMLTTVTSGTLTLSLTPSRLVRLDVGIDSHFEVCKIFGIVGWPWEGLLVHVADSLELWRCQGCEVLERIQADEIRLRGWIRVLISGSC